MSTTPAGNLLYSYNMQNEGHLNKSPSNHQYKPHGRQKLRPSSPSLELHKDQAMASVLNDLGVGNQGITREKFMLLGRSWDSAGLCFHAHDFECKRTTAVDPAPNRTKQKGRPSKQAGTRFSEILASACNKAAPGVFHA